MSSPEPQGYPGHHQHGHPGPPGPQGHGWQGTGPQRPGQYAGHPGQHSPAGGKKSNTPLFLALGGCGCLAAIVVVVVLLVFVGPMLGLRPLLGGSESAEPAPRPTSDSEEEEPVYGEGHTFDDLGLPPLAQADGTEYDCAEYDDPFADLGPRGYEASTTSDCRWETTDKSVRDWEHGDESRRLSIRVQDGVGDVASRYNIGLDREAEDHTLYEVDLGEHGYAYWEQPVTALGLTVVFTDGASIVTVALDGSEWDLSGEHADQVGSTEDELLEETAEVLDIMHG